jgi:conjugal transfer pilus assembly protein TraE
MDKDSYLGEIAQAKTANRHLKFMLGGAILTILILASVIRAQTGETKTAFVPPEITRPFWISSEDASQSYFEDLGQFINNLTLNVTPETVKKSCDQYLTYVLPKDRDAYKKNCDLQVSRVKRDGSSSMFAIKELRTDLKNRRVALTGELVTIIAGRPFPPHLKTYVIDFVHSGGKFYITNHHEADNNDPFAEKK